MRVDELLRTSAGRGLTLVAGPWDVRAVESIAIVDDPDDIERCARGTVAALTRSASLRVAGRSLDAILGQAGRLQLAALAAYGPPTTSVTVIAAASSARVALLAVPVDRDVSELAHDLEAALRSDADAALRRLLATVAVMEYAERSGVDAVLAAASQALGAELRFDAEGGPGAGVPVIVGGRREGVVYASGNDPESVIACRLVADAVARVRTAERRTERARLRTRSELIGEVITAADDDLARLAERARAVDLAVDGDHAVIALEPANARELAGGDPIAAADMIDELVRMAVQAANEADPAWYAHRSGGTILLARVRAVGQPGRPVRDATVGATAAVARMLGRHPQITVYCGASSTHHGAGGLRAAAVEAGGALDAARNARRANTVVHVEGSGLHRLLLEWTSSSATRETVDELLAPIAALGPRRARTAVQTLQVYLDERGSLKRAGASLHLHPNAVAYRIRRVREVLDADLDDPEQRLALQLACRAWNLSARPEAGQPARRVAE